MHYCELWDRNETLGDVSIAFEEDYINKTVRNMPVNYIAIARHHSGFADAVNVWEFEDKNVSLLTRFQSSNNTIVTLGSAIYGEFFNDSFSEDPIFGVNGALMFNQNWSDHGVRIHNTGANVTQDGDPYQDNMNGFGCALTDAPCFHPERLDLKHEVALINNNYDVNDKKVYIISNNESDTNYEPMYEKVNPHIYNNYAIFVSSSATKFQLFNEHQQMTSQIFRKSLAFCFNVKFRLYLRYLYASLHTFPISN